MSASVAQPGKHQELQSVSIVGCGVLIIQATSMNYFSLLEQLNKFARSFRTLTNHAP